MNRIDIFKELPNHAIVAEIGTHRGYFAQAILQLPNIGHLYCVDAWRTYDGYDDPLAGDDHERNFGEAIANTRGFGARCTLIREMSL